MNAHPPAWYPELLDAISAHVAAEQDNPILTAWSIGREILRCQTSPGWSSRTILHLSADLQARFPTRKGLSPRNLRYMRAFAQAWPHEAFARGPLSQLPWHHHLLLIQQLDDLNLRLRYARQSLENNWTHTTLKSQLNTHPHHLKPKR